MGMKKNIPKIREREGNEKKHSQNSGMGRMRKSTPIIRERESEAFIPRNGRGPAHSCDILTLRIQKVDLS